MGTHRRPILGIVKLIVWGAIIWLLLQGIVHAQFNSDPLDIGGVQGPAASLSTQAWTDGMRYEREQEFREQLDNERNSEALRQQRLESREKTMEMFRELSTMPPGYSASGQ